MSKSWLDAAARFRQKTRCEQSEKEEVDLLAKEKESQELREMTQGIAELEEFMRNEGGAAMALLAASGLHLIFGEERESGYCTVYFLDGNGLCSSYEAAGECWLHSSTVPQLRMGKITAREAIKFAVWHGNKKATEVVSWLREQLDLIAAQSLE